MTGAGTRTLDGAGAPAEAPGGAAPLPRGGRRVGRLERSAIGGVLMRELINYSSFWRSSAFESIMEPVVYLLAFGFGLGGLVARVGHIDGAQLAGTVQAREHRTITAVRLHAVATAFGDHRWTDDDARLAACRQVPVNPKPARPGFIDEVQDAVARLERADDLVERFEVAGNHPVVPDLASAVPFSNGYIDRVFVDIEPDKHVTFPHDRPPRVWRCAPSRDAPHNPRDDEDGRSLSVRPRDAAP